MWACQSRKIWWKSDYNFLFFSYLNCNNSFSLIVISKHTTLLYTKTRQSDVPNYSIFTFLCVNNHICFNSPPSHSCILHSSIYLWTSILLLLLSIYLRVVLSWVFLECLLFCWWCFGRKMRKRWKTQRKGTISATFWTFYLFFLDFFFPLFFRLRNWETLLSWTGYCKTLWFSWMVFYSSNYFWIRWFDGPGFEVRFPKDDHFCSSS